VTPLKRSRAAALLAALLPACAVFARAQHSGRIAFSSDRGGNFEIYVMNADGSNVQQATDFKTLRPQDRYVEHHAYDAAPAWSPDGKRLAFTSWSVESGVHRLYVANFDGSSPQSVLVSTGDVRRPRWSYDGQWLAFSGSVDAPDQVYALQLKTLRWTRITRSPDETGRDAPVGGAFPDFSPDMRAFAFGCSSSGDARASSICRTNLDGSRLRTLTKKGGKDGFPRWSPDGARIVFVRDGGAIYLMGADGSNPHMIRGPKSTDPAWSPDGRSIVYSHVRGGAALPDANGRRLIRGGQDEFEALYIMNADGSQAVKITDGDAVDREPDWTQ
jgi:TolB protein